MSTEPSRTGPTSFSHPFQVQYKAVRTTYRHEDDGETSTGLLTINSTAAPSTENPSTIPCICHFEWGYWVVEPDFKCSYYPSEDRFDAFKEPNYITDSTGWYSGFISDSEENYEVKVDEEGNEIYDPDRPTQFPELMLERLDKVDENDHDFLQVRLRFDPREEDSYWWTFHTSRKIWLKRVYEGRDTAISE